MARLLIVDDEPNNLEVAKVIAEAAGHEVVLATNGQIALDKLQGTSFDLLLLDVLMPVMDGITLTRAVRAHAVHGQVRILGMTAKASAADQSEMLAAGMDLILLKPFRRKSLLEAIDKLLPAIEMVS